MPRKTRKQSSHNTALEQELLKSLFDTKKDPKREILSADTICNPINARDVIKYELNRVNVDALCDDVINLIASFIDPNLTCIDVVYDGDVDEKYHENQKITAYVAAKNKNLPSDGTEEFDVYGEFDYNYDAFPNDTDVDIWFDD